MSSSSESDTKDRNKSKKGMKQVEYKSENIKKARVKNEQYVNWQGKVVQPKDHGNDCKCKCKCMPLRVSEDDLLEIYTNLIECQPIKRKHPRFPVVASDGPREKQKSHTFKYALSTSKGRVQVCKAAFLSSSHRISSDRVRRLCNLLSEGKSPKDAGGKNTPGNAKPRSVVKCIEDHIPTFPTKEAHNTRKTFRYFSASLSVKNMWQLFKETNTGISVTYKYYLKAISALRLEDKWTPVVNVKLSVKIKSPVINEIAKCVHAADLLVHKRRSKKFIKVLRELEISVYKVMKWLVYDIAL
ncbi:hypothetical protein PR048_029893 [Dryococelus australis]|uniref:Uncharacterized protein n=1 Tax=Dryococelus australis TaxID=614101 RepID=A0ABQ9GA69_9NEOP|nr:hypothetical protein PR048_029893 [Dryococelus australis]